jgi:cytochrome b6-f complex iron-sulfur subunit
MERREFIKNCGALCAGSFGLGLMLSGCAPVYYATSTSESDRIKVARSEFRDKKGKERKMIVVRSERADYPIAVYKTGNKFEALLMKCSHQGFELSANGDILTCPAHGSEFSKNGEVIQGPAAQKLRIFKVNEDENNIYVELV